MASPLPYPAHQLSSGAEPGQELGAKGRVRVDVHVLVGAVLPATLGRQEVQAVRHLLRPRRVVVGAAGPPTAALLQVARAHGPQRRVVHVRTLAALVAPTAAEPAEEATRLPTESQRPAQHRQTARLGAAGAGESL